MSRKHTYSSKLAEELYELSLSIDSITQTNLNLDQAIYHIILKQYLFTDDLALSSEENFYANSQKVRHILASLEKGLLVEENEFSQEFIKKIIETPDFDRYFKSEADFRQQLNEHLKPKRFLTKISDWVALINLIWIPFGFYLVFGPIADGLKNIQKLLDSSSFMQSTPSLISGSIWFFWGLIWLLTVVIGIIFALIGPAVLAEIIFRTKDSYISKIMKRF